MAVILFCVRRLGSVSSVTFLIILFFFTLSSRFMVSFNAISVFLDRSKCGCIFSLMDSCTDLGIVPILKDLDDFRDFSSHRGLQYVLLVCVFSLLYCAM